MSDLPNVTPTPSQRADGSLQFGIVPLRPLGFADIVSGTAQALRRNAGALLGVALVAVAAAELLRWLAATLFLGEVPALPTDPTKPLDWALARPILIDAAVHLVLAALLGLVLSATVNVVVPRAVFGHTTGARAALSRALPALPGLLGVLGIQVLLFGGAAAFAGLTVFGLGTTGLPIVLPVLFVGVVYLSVAFVFAPSAVVVEGLSPVAALRRSRELVHAGGWWRVLGITAVVTVMFAMLDMVVGTLFANVSGGSAIGTLLALVLVGTVQSAALGAVHSLLYFDHRARAEGIDGLWHTAG